jgi:hypothetical protein
MDKPDSQSNPVEDHLAQGDETSPDYVAWKDAKVRRALKQSEDRSAMIPSDEVWKALDSER